MLLVALLVAQHSAIVDAKFADVYPRSTAHQTQKLTLNLFDELLDFHQHLAAAQVDLPEEAARVLYKNLWQLYD